MIYPQNLKRVNTTVTLDDYKYCSKHGIKFSHAIRAFVRDHKVNSGDANAEPSLRELRNQKDKIQQHRDRILEALRKQMSQEEFFDFIGKL